MDSPAPHRFSRIDGRWADQLRGTARGARTEPIDRHLVMVRQLGWQSAADWERIADHVRDIDPTTAVFVVRGDLAHSYARRLAAKRPSLVFSPGQLGNFHPLRGRVYQGGPIAKLEQLRRLAAAGVSVPRTAALTPDLRLDPAVWGDFVIVKPTDLATSSRGTGVQLMRTSRVRFKRPPEYPPDHPGRRGPMLVQQFINTGERIAYYRALTLFGEPLYLNLGRSANARIDLGAPDEVIERAVVASQVVEKEKYFVSDPDVIALARAAHAAIPEVPLKGCDIVRDAMTGALYVLEVNAGGNTWHFSSNHLAETREANGPEFERRRLEQFDALRTAARVLAEKTRAEAE
jgi:hypothetical protein